MRITNVILLLCVRTIALFSKRRYASSEKKYTKILVIQMAKLGDMVCTTPMFRAIKKHDELIEVVVMGDVINKKLLANNIDVDHYIVAGSVWDNIRAIRSYKPDAVCIAGIDFCSAAAAYIAGVKSIVIPYLKTGKSPLVTRTYVRIQKYMSSVAFHVGQYFPGQYLELLQPLGIVTSDTRKHLGFTDEAKNKIDQLLKKNQFDNGLLIGISPSAGNRIKQWPAKRFGEVATCAAHNHKAKIVIFGGPNDSKEVNEMIEGIDPSVIYLNTGGTLSIDEMKALMSRMHVFIAVDTGPIYVAEAFDVPTLDITGPIDEGEQPPIGDLHRIVIPLDREGPELFVLDARSYDFDEATRQTESISVGQVTNELDDLMMYIKSRK